MHTLIITIHVIVTILLVGIILIQRSDSDGFGASGGGSGSSFMTGRASANLLTRITAILATVFILTSLGLSVLQRYEGKSSIVDEIVNEQSPPTAATPAVPAAPATPAVPKPQ